MEAGHRWRPAADLTTLRRRTELLDTIRNFFRGRGVREVDTPILSAYAATDLHLQSLQARSVAGDDVYFHTSPEFFMKRLLAAGSGDIWQCCRVFRDGEAGRFHNPEFTLVEWYRIGLDAAALMEEVADLLRAAGLDATGVRCYSYAEAFQRYAGLNPLDVSTPALERCGAEHNLQVPGLSRDGWLDLLFSEVVTPQFPAGRIVFVERFPASQAALARLSPDDPATAERFECFVGPLELANGYHELADPAEQRERFQRDNRHRRALGRPEMPMDERLLAALETGLPDCSGVALGFDRLLMAVTGKTHVGQVMAFPVERA